MIIVADDIVIVWLPKNKKGASRSWCQFLHNQMRADNIRVDVVPISWQRMPRVLIDKKRCMLMRILPLYWDVTLDKAGMSVCKWTKTLGDTKSLVEDTTEKFETNQMHVYRILIGRLIWTIEARPGMSLSIKECARIVLLPTRNIGKHFRHVWDTCRARNSMC
jgi:hypothetical protein